MDARQITAALASLSGDRNRFVRSRIAYAFSLLGPGGGRTAVDILTGYLQGAAVTSDQDSIVVFRSAAEALAVFGPDAANSIPALADCLRSPDDSLRKDAVETLAKVTQALQKDAPNLDDTEALRLIGLLQPASAALAKVSIPQFYGDLLPKARMSAVNSVQTLRALVETRRIDRQRRTLRSGFIISSLCAALLVGFGLSVHLRRRVLVLLGKRWRMLPGKCDFVVEITQAGIRARSTTVAEPTVIGCDSFVWPPSPACLQNLHRFFVSGKDIAVMTDGDLFRFPWARVLGSPWSGGLQGTIAGQLFVVDDSESRLQRGGRNIAFGAFACSRASGRETLEAADTEVENVAMIFRRWQADVLACRVDAAIEDVCNGFLNADVMHVAAHASSAGIYLRDGLLDIGILTKERIAGARCRLLFLSACDAGDLAGADSLVYHLVKGGVNVVAATDKVRDSACQTFFEELYGALLPRRQAEGISLSQAIRQAGEACSARFRDAEQLIYLGDRARWRHSIDSFILYGDPTVSFRLL